MHALVTGAGGFVGSFLAEALCAAGWEVTGVRRAGRARQCPVGVRIVETDLRAPRGLPERYDMLLHCAAEIPARCPEPDRLFSANLGTTRAVLDHAASAGVQCVVNMSSMAACGEIEGDCADEATPANAIDAYGRSKAEGERLVGAWAIERDARAVSIRLPGVVGVGSHDNFLSDTLRRMLEGETVVARNPDALFNNIVHVTELAQFAMTLARAMPRGHAILTLGSENPLRVADVLERLARGAGRTVRIEWREKGSRPFLITFDAARRLGFVPRTVADSILRFAKAQADARLRS